MAEWTDDAGRTEAILRCELQGVVPDVVEPAASKPSSVLM